MKEVKWVKYFIFIIFLVLLASTVYALTAEARPSPNMSWPLIINGLGPISVLGLIAYMGGRYLDYQAKTFQELIDAKNDLYKQVEAINSLHTYRGCNLPGGIERRKEVRKRKII